MISLSSLALVALIAAIPAALGFLAGHQVGTNAANKANTKKAK
jgi:hypothetical protein